PRPEAHHAQIRVALVDHAVAVVVDPVPAQLGGSGGGGGRGAERRQTVRRADPRAGPATGADAGGARGPEIAEALVVHAAEALVDHPVAIVVEAVAAQLAGSVWRTRHRAALRAQAVNGAHARPRPRADALPDRACIAEVDEAFVDHPVAVVVEPVAAQLTRG